MKSTRVIEENWSMQIGLLLSLSVKAATTNSSAFQTTREGQSATDFHNKGFLIQADDAAFYFITPVVQLVNLEAFIKEVMGPMGVTSELGDTQCHCHLPKSCLGRGILVELVLCVLLGHPQKSVKKEPFSHFYIHTSEYNNKSRLLSYKLKPWPLFL